MKTTMRKQKLPDRLHAAWNWIDAAGEWSEALDSPVQYAAGAAKNWRDHREERDSEVTESDLLEAIEWERFDRLTPDQQSRYREYVAECREAGTAPSLRQWLSD